MLSTIRKEQGYTGPLCLVCKHVSYQETRLNKLSGHKNFVSALLKSGATPTLADESGATALHCAVNKYGCCNRRLNFHRLKTTSLLV